MIIDREARDQLVQLLNEFIVGKLTNFDFEDKMPSSEDPVIWAIESSIWCFYDDFKEQKLDHLSENAKSMIARCIEFLESNECYKWPKITHPGIRPIEHGLISKLFNGPAKERKYMAYGDYNVWPFISEEVYRSYK